MRVHNCFESSCATNNGNGLKFNLNELSVPEKQAIGVSISKRNGFTFNAATFEWHHVAEAFIATEHDMINAKNKYSLFTGFVVILAMPFLCTVILDMPRLHLSKECTLIKL